MCCFSSASPAGWLARWLAPKIRVSRTNIFARMVAPARQVLAYGMDLKAPSALAMVLPIPVVPDSGDEAVRFIDLSETPRMFDELAELFEVQQVSRAKRGGPRLARQQPLAVHDIGAFVASYVPSRADFTRLDAQFRLPAVLFDAVPAYADYGFAVFQLKPGDVTVHPMAFEFPTRTTDALFFPTVHVHDGRFHATATFDHALYYQHPACGLPVSAFRGDAASWTTPRKGYAGLVDVERPMVRRQLRSRLANADTWID